MFCSRSIGRGGVTLVEMMIAMIITLMIVFAMVEAFRRIGETTTDGRAVIEMVGQMRQARYIFEEDISRCTIPVEFRDPTVLQREQNHGYYELTEGIGNDTNPGRYLVRTPAGLKYNVFNFADVNDNRAAQSRTLFGDLDDVLCLTVCNDQTPYRGRYRDPGPDLIYNTNDDGPTVIVESNYAEIIWWAELNDQPQDDNLDGTIDPPLDNDNDGTLVSPGDQPGEGGYGVWNPGETFTIHRRVLLIRPDLNRSDLVAIADANDASPALFSTSEFLRYNDISVHYHFDESTFNYRGLKTNSLSDLTMRWNRVAHWPITYALTSAAGPLGLHNFGLSSPPADTPLPNQPAPGGLTVFNALSPLDPSQLPAFASADLRGEDVVLSNVTAFDLRVWDPSAPVCGYTPLNGEIAEGLVPGDPGYADGLPPGDPNYAARVTASTQGFGAFVDLGVAAQSSAASGFIAGMNAGAHLHDGTTGYLPYLNFVYDPWTLAYESDRFDQDNSGVADQGTNGVDDNGVNGADDLMERETVPPYPFPLKVMQARIRMYEPDTRQVKQISQNIEFAK